MITAEALGNTDLFRDLPDQTLETIAGFATSTTFEEGEHVYQLGDDADDLYFLDTGRIRFSLGVGNRPEASGSWAMQIYVTSPGSERLSPESVNVWSHAWVWPGASVMSKLLAACRTVLN